MAWPGPVTWPGQGDPGGDEDGSGVVGVGVGVGVRVLVRVGVGRADVRDGLGDRDGVVGTVWRTVGRAVGECVVGAAEVGGGGNDVGSAVTGALVGLFTCRTPGEDWAMT
jgi:hypothetical protein